MSLKDIETKPLDLRTVRELKDEELQTELNQLEDAHFRLKVRRATEGIENPIRFRTIRRNIARMKTVLRERKES